MNETDDFGGGTQFTMLVSVLDWVVLTCESNHNISVRVDYCTTMNTMKNTMKMTIDPIRTFFLFGWIIVRVGPNLFVLGA